MKKSNLWKTISIFVLCLSLSLVPAVGKYMNNSFQMYCVFNGEEDTDWPVTLD